MQPNDSNNILNNLPRLEWACRRGMLELDILLSNFLHEKYMQLTIENKQRFVDLLNCTDPELFAWLMGHETPTDSDFLIITEEIRQRARTRI